MEDILLAPYTDLAIKQIMASPPNALVIVGDSGAGKQTIAKALLSAILEVQLDTHPYYKEIAPLGHDITIEQIREIQAFLSLKTTGKAQFRRAILIQNAHTMNIQAQNALLKTLEEPPLDTLIVLTCVHIDNLLPTIRSRVQKLTITPVDQDRVLTYFSALRYDEATILKAYAVCGGNAGLLTSLLKNDSDTSVLADIDDAKSLLRKTAFERLAEVDRLAKDKDNIEGLLVALARICRAALHAAASKGKSEVTAAWLTRLKLIVQAQDDFAKMANTKLLLTHLFMNL